MRVLIFGATGMVGHAVLKECLEDDGIAEVITVGRREAPEDHPKLRQIVHADFSDLSPVEAQFAGVDACFYCIGVSSGGMSEERYREVTVGYTVNVAESLRRVAPDVAFCFVSGAGTDAASKQMWARVKAEAEDALRDFGFGGLYVFRPAYIQPRKGVASQVGAYRAMYALAGPLYPLWKKFPKYVTASDEVGRAMINAVRLRPDLQILENVDICNLAAKG